MERLFSTQLNVKALCRNFLVYLECTLPAMEFPPRKDDEKMRDLTPTYLPTYLLVKSARDLLTPTIRTLTHFPHTILLILVTHFPPPQHYLPVANEGRSCHRVSNGIERKWVIKKTCLNSS